MRRLITFIEEHGGTVITHGAHGYWLEIHLPTGPVCVEYVRDEEDWMALNLGEPGNCLSCSKHRDHVIGESCLDCRIYYKIATEDEIIAVQYAQDEYKRGYFNGMTDSLSSSSTESEK